MKKRISIFLSLIFVLIFSFSISFSSLATEEVDNSTTEEKEYTKEELDEMRNALDRNYEKERYEREKEDYYIKDLDVDITVLEDNTFRIKETYVYDFVLSHHGPTRKFITNHSRYYGLNDYDLFHEKRVTVKSKKVIAKIKNLKVSSDTASANIASKSAYTAGDTSSVTYKIGSKSKTYTGEHKYTFSYDYKIYSPDPLENADELYFNIIGTENECPVDHASFTIRMPKDFDTSTLGFSTGSRYSKGYDQNVLKYEVNNRVIKGEYTKPLLKGQGITVRCLLPDGYFKFTDNTNTGRTILHIIFGLFLIMALPWHKLFNNYVEVVNFYPPKDMSPVAVETVYKGHTPGKITSMIPYLANKGCFKIVEGGKKDFAFSKIDRDNSDLDYAGQTFVNGLFKKKDHVTKSDLNNSFYKTIEKIRSHYSSEASDMFTSTSKKLTLIGLFIATIATYIGMLSIDRYLFYNSDTIFSIMGLIASASVFIIGLLNRYADFNGKLLLNIIHAFFTMIPLLVFYVDEYDLNMNNSLLYGFLLIVFCNAFTYTLSSKNIRTDENKKLYGEIMGFRNFIKTAELDRLKALSVENPKYFYDILGYAYVFGLEKKWISKFALLQEYVEDPDWYYGGRIYDYYTWAAFNHAMSYTYSNMASSPSSGGSGGGGGYSGGGFSGGGSGGGGAGAW